MMVLSLTMGYAVHALGALCGQEPCMVFVKDIAAGLRLPKPYLAKIINHLERAGIVKSKRGYRGGVVLARPPQVISLLEVVEAVEPSAWASPCVFGLEFCPVNYACPAHGPWTAIRNQMRTLLQSTSLADMVRATRRGKNLVSGRPG